MSLWRPLRAVLLGIVAALVVAVCEAVWFRLRGSTPVPGPYDLDGSAGTYEGVAPLSWVWLGDSLSAGVGAGSPSEAFPTQTARLVASQASREVYVRCLARPGARSADVLAEQVPAAMKLLAPGATVIVAVGCNDTLRGVRPKMFRANYRSILDSLRETGATVVAVGVPDMGAMMAVMAQPLRFVVGRYARYLDRIVRDAASESGVLYATIAGGASSNEWRCAGARSLLWEDRWHPNGDGYRAWANTVAAQLSTRDEVVAPHS
jgi:lysophospholipase L1-like esterase